VDKLECDDEVVATIHFS